MHEQPPTQKEDLMMNDMDQLGFDDLLTAADTDNRTRAFERETAHLPGSMEEALPFYRALMERHHSAVLAADIEKTMTLREEGRLLARKLNGGEPGILAHEDAPGCVLEREAAAAPGALPLWGQTGAFVITACDMRICIELEGIFGIGSSVSFWSGFAAYAVDLDADFPLRGFVVCSCCGHPMTSAWSKGRNTKYPYYFCYQHGCPEYRKSIRKERMEEEFERLLQSMTPKQNLFALAREILGELWQQRMGGAHERAREAKVELTKLEQKGDQLMERIMQAESHTLIAAYETQIQKLEEQKIVLGERVKNCGRPLQGFDETFRTACAFLANPHKLWLSEQLEDQRMVLRLAFAGRVSYQRNEDFRAVVPALPFKVLAGIQRPGCGLVGLKEESLNQLFETLADWNIVLNEISHDLEPMS